MDPAQHRLAQERPVWRTRAWAAAGVVLLSLIALFGMLGFDGPGTARAMLVVLAVLVAAVGAVTLMRVRRQRRAFEERLTEWAAEQAAQAERLALARELHDLASHGLGLITVRAAAAGRAAGDGAAAERARALRDIERASRGATTELRRMLSLLRSPGVSAPLRPAPALADLPEIVRQVGGGLRVRLDADGAGEVSAGVGAAVCAIVREGLANAARHAGPTGVEVSVSRDGGAVLVRVADAGPVAGWEPVAGAGHGLLGLRERVEALNGRLEAGSSLGGHRLVARIPDAHGSEAGDG